MFELWYLPRNYAIGWSFLKKMILTDKETKVQMYIEINVDSTLGKIQNV